MSDRGDDNWREEVAALLVRGDKIAAIRVYRDHTGAGLAEAKTFVEGLQRALRTGSLPSEPNTDLDAELLAKLHEGQYIDAIKRHRAATGSGLKDAKDAVDTLAAAHGIERRSGAGCLGVAVAMGLWACAACM